MAPPNLLAEQFVKFEDVKVAFAEFASPTAPPPLLPSALVCLHEMKRHFVIVRFLLSA